MEKLPLSAIILTRNEERHLGRALASLTFAAEILVIDAGSTDQTQAIALANNARFINSPWPGFRIQRNRSLEAAKYEWVLVVDADEAATPELETWLRDFFIQKKNLQAPYGYKIHRIEYFLGRKIQGACWNPSYQDRFLRRDKASYVGEIHEYPEVEGGVIRAPEAAALLHNPDVSVESILEKMNRYTTVEAWDRYRKGERTNLPHIFVAFFATWWKNFFYYRAYRDGAYGFIIAILEAVSRTVRHVKLWQIQELSSSGREKELVGAARALDAGASMHRHLEGRRDL